MGEFKPDWLALREAADVPARSSRLTRAIADRFPEDAELHVLDIATGTGANVRYLAEQLPPRQSWLLVDQDPVLLAELPMRMRSWGVPRGLEIAGEGDELLVTGARLTCRLVRFRRDLALDIEGGDGDIFAGRRLVTASALLDLVSERWLRAFASRCRHSCAAVLFALTIVLSIAIQAIGAFCFPSSWNLRPVNVDTHHERLWDWRDSELVRCLIEGRKPW